MNLKYNKSSMFLFPFLGIPKDLFKCSVKNIFKKELFNNRFLNCYLSHDIIKETDNNQLFLLVRNYRDISFDIFYSTITALPNYKEDYEIDNCLIMIFTIPPDKEKDYNLILKGKYSLISSEGKRAIILNSFNNYHESTIPMILNKSTTLKEMWESKLGEPGEIDLGEQEVWSIIEKKEEILNKNIIKVFSKKDKFNYKGEY